MCNQERKKKKKTADVKMREPSVSPARGTMGSWSCPCPGGRPRRCTLIPPGSLSQSRALPRSTALGLS